MAQAAGQLVDWKDAQDYAPLLGADRASLAWEWLRRTADYRHAAAGKAPDEPRPLREEQPEAGRFGLHAFEHPSVGVPLARPVWRAGWTSRLIVADVEPFPPGQDAFELAVLDGLWTVARSPGGVEHLLLSDGRAGLRLDLGGSSILGGPVLLRYRLAGLASLERPMAELRRLAALCGSGDPSRLHDAGAAAGARAVLLLRAADGLAVGASQREIAEVLLSRDARQPRWRIEAPSLRSRAQRLVRKARAMAKGRWRDLLA